MSLPGAADLAGLPRVILVHGLFMGPRIMRPLSGRLRREGFEVTCFGYNTVSGSLAGSAARLAAFLGQQDPRPVALVGHSLGGLVALQSAQNLPSSRLAAVVLLGTPYQGAAAARVLRKMTGGARSRIGRALHDWADLSEKPTVAAPVFTLAGTRGRGIGRLLCRFREANDGTVTVAETRYPGASACLMRVSHAGLLFSDPVARQVAAWLHHLPEPPCTSHPP